MPTAYLVLGPETSGNRWLTSLHIEAGCAGSAAHKQPFDSELPDPADEPLIVLRRSLPYWGRWPDLRYLVQRLRRAGYAVVATVIVRDWQVTRVAQTRAGYGIRDEQHAHERMREALRRIVTSLVNDCVEWTLVTYESLILHPHEAVASLFDWLGLPAPEINAVDGNEKYYLKGQT